MVERQRAGPEWRRPVVLRESSAVLGSLASVALSPSGGEAHRSDRLGRSGRRRRYPFPFPAGCRGGTGNGGADTLAAAW